MIHFQALTWDSKDEHGQYMINIFGKTDDGKSVYTKVKYNPKFYVEIPDSCGILRRRNRSCQDQAKLSGQCDVVGCGSMPYCSMKNKKCNGDACYSCEEQDT